MSMQIPYMHKDDSETCAQGNPCESAIVKPTPLQHNAVKKDGTFEAPCGHAQGNKLASLCTGYCLRSTYPSGHANDTPVTQSARLPSPYRAETVSSITGPSPTKSSAGLCAALSANGELGDRCPTPPRHAVGRHDTGLDGSRGTKRKGAGLRIKSKSQVTNPRPQWWLRGTRAGTAREAHTLHRSYEKRQNTACAVNPWKTAPQPDEPRRRFGGVPFDHGTSQCKLMRCTKQEGGSVKCGSAALPPRATAESASHLSLALPSSLR
ncbi:hypothetical protein B0H17DRAFT_1154761 [Mycena rosella]|uniref:Uncharacterized protein n=1 Tax=Mycena rosella TaxID=1033263 RepID=A0AAD7AXH1_MYCRO|nr:hypothetical protein B0H17DRAFT_1154761 [Mycena rosella]